MTPQARPSLADSLRVVVTQRVRDAAGAPDAYSQSIALADVRWFTDAADLLDAADRLEKAAKRLRDLVELGQVPCLCGPPHAISGEEATFSVIEADTALSVYEKAKEDAK